MSDGSSAQVTPLTVGAAIRWGAAKLQRAGVETPGVDSRLLMAYALGPGESLELAGTTTLGASHVPAIPRRPASPTELFFAHDQPVPAVFQEWITQRCERTPLQHIVNVATFDGVDFFSQPGAFIPRPETELLVEWAFREALRRSRDRAHTQAPPTLVADTSCNPTSEAVSVVDLCTGPGSIALALACRFTDADLAATVTGVELHDGALQVARLNERQLRHRGLIGDQVEVRFHRAEIRDIDQLRAQRIAAPDLIVSNPPYVPTTASVSAEVLHDPTDAVFAGADGMEFLPGLIQALRVIAGGEQVGVGIEHDDANGPATAQSLQQAGAANVQQHRDIAGRDRFVTAQLNGQHTD